MSSKRPCPEGRQCTVPCDLRRVRGKHSLVRLGSVVQHAYSDMGAVTLAIHTKQHDGHAPGAAIECHDVFRLGNINVHVRTSGRSHSGSITFRFTDSLGQPCTAADWVVQHQEPWLTTTAHSKANQTTRYFGTTDYHNNVHDGPGISIVLTTSGRCLQ